MTRTFSILLAIVTLGILTLAVVMMIDMDRSSRSQGGRFYVAVAALALLGAVLSRFSRFLERRSGAWFTVTAPERQFALVSLLVMLFSTSIAVGIIGASPRESSRVIFTLRRFEARVQLRDWRGACLAVFSRSAARLWSARGRPDGGSPPGR